MTDFRDRESSEAEIAAVLENKEQIKEGLLKKLSTQSKDRLEDLMRENEQNDGQLNPGKAYGAAFLAYYTVELAAAMDAAGNSAWYAAMNATMNASYNAAYVAAWYASWNAVFTAVRPSVGSKLKILALKSSLEIGPISYDLAEQFTLLYLTENAHAYMKKAFNAVYEEFPEMELAEVKGKIAAAIKQPELKDNMFIKALKRGMKALEKFVLAK